MQTPTIINARQQAESSKETPSYAKPKNFREHFKSKVEKTEEREPKKRSIFEIIGDAAAMAIPKTFSIPSSPEIAIDPSIPPLSKEQAAAIIAEAARGITHCVDQGVKETTLRLDAAPFAKSPLFGSELIVREFSTAPLTFNVEFRCSPAALAFLKPHLPTLCAAFHFDQPKEYAIHRIDALLEDFSPFHFHRKPPPESGNNDRGG